MKVICYIDEALDLQECAHLLTKNIVERSKPTTYAFSGVGQFDMWVNPSGSITIRKEGVEFKAKKREARCKKTVDMFDGEAAQT